MSDHKRTSPITILMACIIVSIIAAWVVYKTAFQTEQFASAQEIEQARREVALAFYKMLVHENDRSKGTIFELGCGDKDVVIDPGFLKQIAGQDHDVRKSGTTNYDTYHKDKVTGRRVVSISIRSIELQTPNSAEIEGGCATSSESGGGGKYTLKRINGNWQFDSIHERYDI